MAWTCHVSAKMHTHSFSLSLSLSLSHTHSFSLSLSLSLSLFQEKQLSKALRAERKANTFKSSHIVMYIRMA